MIKTFFAAVFMLIFSQSILPQGWQWVDTGFPFIIYDMSFPAGQSDIGYAVGSSSTYNGDGIILKTTDGGQSWSQISVGTIPGLEAVAFTSTDVGYAGGWQNYFIKTTDGGTTWNQVNVNAGVWYFKEIEFWDANHGMTSTADPQIYVTSDAGATWTAATGLNQGVEDICYVDANIAYAVGGDEKISRSTDGGLSWTQIHSGTPTYLFLGVEFYGANYGIVGGEDGKVLVTTDGGTSWATSNAGGYGLMHGVYIFNEDSSYVAGTPEQVFKSTNGGTTWVSDFNGANSVALYKIKFTENGTGIICGSQGKFLRNTDYVVQPEPAQAYAYDGGIGSYVTVDLSTGLPTSINMGIQGSYFPVSADNNDVDEQYVAMSDYSATSFFLAHINFTTQTQDSVGPIAPLASGQTQIKALAYNAVTDVWYLISGDDFASAGVLYTIDINTGTLTEVGTIQNAAAPITLAIDCDGNAYVVNIEGLLTTEAVLYSLDLSTAVATQIGTDLGFPDVTYGGQDMDFDPENGNLYWGAYWSSGFFSEGPSFRLIDVTAGTSTEIVALGEFDNYVSFTVNSICQTLPVELTSFSANVNDNDVSLYWNTATETNNSGFNIERKSGQSDWQTVGFVPGFGTSTEQHSYSFKDNQVGAGSYSYRLKQVDYDGSYQYSNEVEAEITNPVGFNLAQNYPNPFNPSTTINFSIPVNEVVNLTVFNALGEQVTVLMNKELTAGHYTVNFNASGLASGIYILRMKAGNFVEMKKMNLLK